MSSLSQRCWLPEGDRPRREGKGRPAFSEPSFGSDCDCGGPDEGTRLITESGTNVETNCRISSTTSLRPSAMRSRRRSWAANSAAFATWMSSSVRVHSRRSRASMTSSTMSRLAEISRSLAVFSIRSHCSGVTRMVLVNVSAIAFSIFLAQLRSRYGTTTSPEFVVIGASTDLARCDWGDPRRLRCRSQIERRQQRAQPGAQSD